MSQTHAKNGNQRFRTIAWLTAMTPLLMAADCNGGSSGGSGDILNLVSTIINLVLSIIEVAS